MITKGLAVGIIFLFISLAFTPFVSAYQQTEVISSHTSSKGGIVRLIVSEYRADGSIKRVPFVMSRDEFNSMKNELKGTKLIDGQLSVYKKYGLIPENVSGEKLQQGMMEKAEKMGFSQSQINVLSSQNQVVSLSRRPRWFLISMDFFSSVDGVLMFNFKFHDGLSVLTSPINVLFLYSHFYGNTSFYLHSADIIDVFLSASGDITTRRHDISDEVIAVVMSGFVGYMIDVSPFAIIYPLLSVIPFPLLSLFSIFSGYAIFEGTLEFV